MSQNLQICSKKPVGAEASQSKMVMGRGSAEVAWAVLGTPGSWKDWGEVGIVKQEVCAGAQEPMSLWLLCVV